MVADTQEEVARRVAAWGRAGDFLTALRRREVAELRDDQALAATIDLLSALDQLPRLPPRPSSGLVEQQRWFAKARS